MRIPDGTAVLLDRVKALDGDLTSENLLLSEPPASRTSVSDAEKFIHVLDMVTSIGNSDAVPVISATDADAILADCRLIDRLQSVEPALVSGDIDGRPQYWVSTGRPPWVSPGVPELSQANFVSVSRGDWTRKVQPLGSGLYTCTGFRGTQGMWRVYLDLGDYSSNFPYPWYVWEVNVHEGARVCNVTTATQWQELALNYPAIKDGLMYPDWGRVADDWDAVHITISAVAAIQGLRLRSANGLLAPSYWDVETTFWLRWSFSSVSLVETVLS